MAASPGEPSSRRVQLDTGLRYHYLEWAATAPENAPVLILLHGFLDFAWTWEAVVSSGLLGSYRILAPDLRGHGDSDRVGAGGYYHFLDYLADLRSFIERTVGADPAVRISLCGHSMGGSVAAYYSGAFAEQVERLVILEGLGPPEQLFETVPTRVRSWLAAWKRAAAQPLRPMRDLDEAAARLRRHDPRLDPILARRLAEHGTTALADGQRQFKHDPLHLTPGPLPFSLSIAAAFWRQIRCPVLLVSATDSDFQLRADDLAHRISCFGSGPPQIAQVADAGHMMQRHQPAAVAALLHDFLK